VEQHVVGAEDDVLHHHVLVPLELGIRWQRVSLYLQYLLPVDGNALGLAALRPLLRLAPFLFRRDVLAGRSGLVGLDLGLALFPFQPGVLVAQTLNLRLRGPQVGHHVFQQIEQPDDELSGPFVLNAAQIKVVQHSPVSISQVRQEKRNRASKLAVFASKLRQRSVQET